MLKKINSINNKLKEKKLIVQKQVEKTDKD